MDTKNNDYTIVKQSDIHHKGVFAKVGIPKGTKIIQYKGERISKAEGDKRVEIQSKTAENSEDKGQTYIFELNDDYDIDGDVPDNDAKYINHSCDPNCDFEIEEDEIWIYAKRDIKAGEELSYNYGFDFDEKYHENPCRCNSPNCVGYILSEDEWLRLHEFRKHDRNISENSQNLK
jgi:uncharacterized protein